MFYRLRYSGAHDRHSNSLRQNDGNNYKLFVTISILRSRVYLMLSLLIILTQILQNGSDDLGAVYSMANQEIT